MRDGAEAALAAAEVADGGGQVDASKSGHMVRGEDQFGVGAFPEQKVAQAALAAGADQQVDGRARGRAPGHRGKVPAVRAAAARMASRAGVVDGDAQPQAVAPGGGRFGPADRGAELRIQAVAAADHFQADALA